MEGASRRKGSGVSGRSGGSGGAQVGEEEVRKEEVGVEEVDDGKESKPVVAAASIPENDKYFSSIKFKDLNLSE